MTRDFVARPTPPLMALVGGRGVRRKATFLRGLVERFDTLALGGIVGNTFLVADGHDMASSEYEMDGLAVAKEVLQAARARNIRLLLPTDFVVHDGQAAATGPWVNRELTDLTSFDAALDIGTATRQAFREALAQSSTVLWNGLLGDERDQRTLEGTRDLLRALEGVAYGGVVGRRSAARAVAWGLSSKVRWIATSGDASLELMVGVVPPGIDSLRQPLPRPALVVPDPMSP
jgi:phosphoglycerate kinase